MTKPEKNNIFAWFSRGISVFSLLLISGTFLTFPFTVNAQGATSLGLSVAPQVFELDVWPGETISKKIYLGNLSSVAMPIEVQLTDFTAEEDSGEMLFDESDKDISFSSKKWFKIEPRNFILEPGERKKIEFSINVPREAEPGGHYSVILFEPVLPSFYFREGQPRNIPVIGSLFLLSVKTLALEPEVAQKLEVVEFSIPKEERLIALENFVSKLKAGIGELSSVRAQVPEIKITEFAPSVFSLKIKNKDIYHLKPSGKILVYNFWGNRVGEFEVPQKTILPGKTRQFPVELSLTETRRIKWLPVSISNFISQNFFVGRYSAVLELKESSGDQNLKLARNIFFWSFPWKFWLPLLLTLVLFLFFIVKYKKRIVLALRTLIGR